MKTIRLGLIGAGGIAQAHCNAISGIEGVEVVATADIVEANAKGTAERWNIPATYTDYEKMLAKEDIDGVIVATPTACHAAPTIAALEAGKHVLCEKPMEASQEAATAMVKASHDSGNILMVALKLRYSNQVKVARRLIEEGALGDIYYAETVASRRRGNPGGSFIKKATAGLGAAADIGVYALDTALYLMGHPKPVAVSAIVSNDLSRGGAGDVLGSWGSGLEKTEVDDFAAAWVLFENGIRMVFKTSWCMHIDDIGGTFFLGSKAGLRIGVGEVIGPGTGVWLSRDEYGVMTNSEVLAVGGVDGGAMFRAENAAFADAIREGKPSPIDPDGMLLTNVIIQGALDSAAAGGREVKVTVPTF